MRDAILFIVVFLLFVGGLAWIIVSVRRQPVLVVARPKKRSSMWGAVALFLAGLLLVAEGIYLLKTGKTGRFKAGVMYWWQDAAIGVPLIYLGIRSLAAARKKNEKKA